MHNITLPEVMHYSGILEHSLPFHEINGTSESGADTRRVDHLRYERPSSDATLRGHEDQAKANGAYGRLGRIVSHLARRSHSWSDADVEEKGRRKFKSRQRILREQSEMDHESAHH